MYKITIFIILSICVFIVKFFTYKIKIDILPDIVISPGGKTGFYTMGICHYIRNNFDITNKKVIGFSSGSWCSIMFSIKKELINDLLKSMFLIKIHKKNEIVDLLCNILNKYNTSEFDLNNTYIGVANLAKNSLVFHNEFISIDHFARCCKTSSFVPFFTSKNLLCFYENNLSFDGGLGYSKFKKKLINKPLIINHKMFIHNKDKTINKKYKDLCKVIYKKKTITIYNSYIKGYHDAKLNHKYFQDYLEVSSSYSS
jgi:hypothetical protein